MALNLFQKLQANENPVDFMINYLKNNYGNRPSVNDGEKMELAFLEKEAQRLT